MAYLTVNEIPLYCTSVPGITMDTIETASVLIDAYKGQSFFAKEYTENSKLTKKRSAYGDIYRGKLKHLPRVSVDTVKSYVINAFGELTETTYDPLNIRFDEDDSVYFQFIPQRTMNYPFSSMPPTQLTVSYKSGYTIDNIPEILKRVTGLLAENLKKNGGTFAWKSRDDFDVKITLADSSIFPMELRQMVNMVKLS